MARIIYVEDDPVMGGLVQEVLGAAGHNVGVIGHGQLALDTIPFKKPDMVILDLTLPGMDGVEILRRLRQMSAMYLTPVLVLTGQRGALSVDIAIDAGANDYIVKPFDPADLIARVDAALESGRYVRGRVVR